MRPPTRGPHFFVAPEAVEGRGAVLRGDDARHLERVLRACPGDPVSLADGCGRVWQAQVATLGRTGGEVWLALARQWHLAPPVPRLVVVHALPKGRKLDAVVQGLSEVGADRLVPVATERTAVRLGGERARRALRRWRAVALAAAKQARRARPLEVAPAGSLDEALPAGTRGAVLWEGATAPLTEVLPPQGPQRESPGEVVLAVGPEGGLSAAEVEGCGLAAASLGPTILRTETAALVATTLALHRLGRLG